MGPSFHKNERRQEYIDTWRKRKQVQIVTRIRDLSHVRKIYFPITNHLFSQKKINIYRAATNPTKTR